jgi:hypothetical protein
VQPMVTWYDILDVMSGATTEEIQGKHDSQASLLRTELIAGAPSAVITAVSRAQQLLDTARDVLGDPQPGPAMTRRPASAAAVGGSPRKRASPPSPG